MKIARPASVAPRAMIVSGVKDANTACGVRVARIARIASTQSTFTVRGTSWQGSNSQKKSIRQNIVSTRVDLNTMPGGTHGQAGIIRHDT